MNLRKTRYGTAASPVSLAYIPSIEQRPEYVEPPPPPPEPAIPRPPRYSVSRKRKPDSGFEAVLRRIEIGSV